MTFDDDECPHDVLDDGTVPGYPLRCLVCGEHLRDPEDDEPDYVVAVLS